MKHYIKWHGVTYEAVNQRDGLPFYSCKGCDLDPSSCGEAPCYPDDSPTGKFIHLKRVSPKPLGNADRALIGAAAMLAFLLALACISGIAEGLSNLPGGLT